VLFKGIKKWSPPFRATTIHIQNGKAELTSDLSLGSSAIFSEIHRFPSPPHGRFGFIREISLVKNYGMILSKRQILSI
jgi:hypothetical protein